MELRERVYGFEVCEKNYVHEVEGQVYKLQHLKTGAQVIVVENEDVKKSFLVGFRTIPEDSTGVFHILEHSVLNGSAKYPEKDTFVNLMKNSMAEFINAITYPDHTVYPFCTENEKDFMNLMDVYLNAVFYPNVINDKSIFEQEGWHFQDETNEQISGVVYNEMQGVFSSLDSVLMYETFETMFPNTAYRFVSGGRPESIPNLSYEQFVKAYKRFYNPTNCCIVLYGKMNVEEKLEYIDRAYFRKMEGMAEESFSLHQKSMKRFSEKVYDKEKYGDQGTFAACSYLLGNLEDRKRLTAVYILVQALLGDDEAPLKKAVMDKLQIPNIQFFVMDGIAQPYLSVTIKNVNKQIAEQLKDTLEVEVKAICEKGIDKKLLLSAINSQEFWTREKGGASPDGIECALGLATGWTHRMDVTLPITYEDVFENLKQQAEGDYFETLLKELFLENEHWSEVLLLGEESDREEHAESFELTLEDLKKDDLEEATTIETNENIVYLKHDILTKGIVYQNSYFDISDLSSEEVSYAKLLASLLGNLPTKLHTLEELVVEKNMWLGDISFYLDVFSKENKKDHVCLKFVADTSCLEQNLEKAMKILEEILYDSLLDNPDIIHKKIQQQIMDLEMGFVSNGNGYALERASAHYLIEGVARERYSGITYYRFLKNLLEEFEVHYSTIIESLNKIVSKICFSSPLTMSCTATDEVYKRFRSLVEKSKLCQDARSETAGYYSDHFLPGKAEAFIIPSEVSYSAMGSTGEYTGKKYLLGKMISYDYLWHKIRVEGGAYGCGMNFNANNSWEMSTYRDPNVTKTLESFGGVSKWLRELEIQEEDFLNYKIGAVAKYDRTPKTYGKVKRMDGWYLREDTKSRRTEIRNGILNTTVEELKSFSEAFEQSIKEGFICVLGNEEKIEEAREMFDRIEVLVK